MAELDLLKPGTKVMLAGEIEATITAVCLRGKALLLTYECAWWDDRTRRSDWVQSGEVTVKEFNQGPIRQPVRLP